MTDSLPATVPLAHDVGGAGTPLLLLPGTGYPRHTWHPEFLAGLAARHTLITLDYRGTGDTPGTDDPYSTRLFAADAAALVRDLGVGPVHVAGHSMGGRVTQWFALDAPELTRSVTLLASGPGPTDPAVVPERLPLYAMTDLVENGYRAFMAGTITRNFFTPEYGAAHPDAVQWLIDAFWDHRPPVRDYLKHVIARQSHRTTEHLDRITQPALVVVGTRDTHVGGTGSHYDQSVYLARALPDARFVEIPDTMHGYPWQEVGRTVEAMTAFTAEVDARG